jgi:hypothetical protein
MGVVGDRIGPTRARTHSAQFGYLVRLFALLAACALGLSGASVAAANARPSANARRSANARQSANARARTEASHRKRAKPSGAGRFKRPAVLSSAERSDFDQVNVDRLESRVGFLKSSAVLEAIANKRVHQMALRHSDYAGYDVRVNLRQEKLCVKGAREIEDQLQGGGGGSNPSIVLPINQPAARGRNAVLLAQNLVNGIYGFGLEAAGRIRLPDGDRVTIPISQAGIGAKEAVTVSPSC